MKAAQHYFSRYRRIILFLLTIGVPLICRSQRGEIRGRVLDAVNDEPLLTHQASPQFGSRRTNGIIAIYTKAGGISQLPTEKNYLAFKVLAIL